MEITIVPNDMDAPGFYRVLSPARQLAAHGHKMILPHHRQFPAEDGSIITEFSIDLKEPEGDLWVMQQRKERMWAQGGINQLRLMGVATVADVDDNYIELPEWNPAFYGTHPYRNRKTGVIQNRQKRRALAKRNSRVELAKESNDYNRNHMHEVLKTVDALTVSTPYLADLYKHHNENITVIRNYLDWEMWEDVELQYAKERWQNRVRIGYLGVFKYRRGDLEILKDVVPKFMLAHPEVDFVANSPLVHDFLGVPKSQRVVVKEYHFYPRGQGTYPLPRKTAVLDIGLVPLADHGLNKAKSHLKGMEYNAVGAPYIASRTESYEYFTSQVGVHANGFIVDTPQEWTDRLEYLVTAEQMRRECGAFARSHAAVHTIQGHWREYESAYLSVLGDELTAIARASIAHGAVQKVSELRNLLQLATSTGPLKTVVEVGSAAGGTFWALSQVASEDALMISIDMPSGSPLDVREGKDVYSMRGEREDFRALVRENQKCVLIDGNSQSIETLDKLVDTLGVTKIDLLLIDADHRLAGVTKDYLLYAPLVRQGGVIAFHDVIVQNDKRSGVHLLWNKLERRANLAHRYVGKDAWGLGTWGGIGAIIRDGELPRV